jgi:hypothetical protein
VVIARGIVRIHAENLVSFGIPSHHRRRRRRRHGHAEPRHHEPPQRAARRAAPQRGNIAVNADGQTIRCQHSLSPRQADMLFAGGCIPWKRRQLGQDPADS